MASLITRLGIGLLSKVVDILIVAGITIWDLALILYNLVAPERDVGKVTPAGCPGAGGKWPEYIAPKEGDSRCSCPALNAMANHGAYAYSHTLKLRRSAPIYASISIPIFSLLRLLWLCHSFVQLISGVHARTTGIIPRNGRNIPFRTLEATIRPTFNFAPTFCLFVPRYMAEVLGRNHWKDTLNLEDIDVHNGIEHDASLLR